MTIEFTQYPKTPRWFRPVVVTEKIDGTNAGIIITEDGEVGAQSRTRIITPGKSTDNYGFAGWVERNADALREVLGPGLHMGEWWGQGIQRRYGLDKKVFSLFDPRKYPEALVLREEHGLNVDVVPQLYSGPNDELAIRAALNDLVLNGSIAAALWGQHGRPAEGICIFHSANRQVFKVLAESDHLPKGALPPEVLIKEPVSRQFEAVAA